MIDSKIPQTEIWYIQPQKHLPGRSRVDAGPYSYYILDFLLHLGTKVTLHGYLVTAKRTTTSGGLQMGFGTFLTQCDEYLDTVHFPEAYQRYPFEGIGVYRLEGIIREEYGYYTLEVGVMTRLSYQPDPRFSG